MIAILLGAFRVAVSENELSTSGILSSLETLPDFIISCSLHILVKEYSFCYVLNWTSYCNEETYYICRKNFVCCTFVSLYGLHFWSLILFRYSRHISHSTAPNRALTYRGVGNYF